MQIKEVARRLNTTSRSIRFYEEKGLIYPGKDSENDYRTFMEKDIIRISTILAMREIGISVKDIGEILQNPDMSMRDYLNLQRSVLFEKWIEMKDMIETIDVMVDRVKSETYEIEDIFLLAKHLKGLKNARANWNDKWNFDKQAAGYDRNLKMCGYRFNVHQDYEKALKKVVETVQFNSGDVCLDIGAGTGNLGSKLLSKSVKVIGIDQSEKMLQICNGKHPDMETRKGHFLALPILDSQADGIVSSYALHHLTDEEKVLAFKEMDRVLKGEGQICIVDLMFLHRNHREQVIKGYHESGNTEAIEAIEDEFYADRSVLVEWFIDHNYQVKTHQFNDILSMIYAVKSEKS
ncbi:transcriptional regulator [Virgibacillus phasianinus]|uniref:Transcriptional regulator n=1 Tax=Virgibacillus phasianinus TaxID=2017483 RepID=A0A220U1Q1_9BACI|nr:methyltransferase domain-containing protein [Virgibacillus phasianinus]ASK61942.1 transcriptional regulator [Virgibacillus phasianinus]